jgi:ribosomal protein S6--L-glutamate ligase
VLSGDAASLPDDAPFEGPFLVEPLLRHDGTDRKLYVAGSSVRGLRKPSTLAAGHVTAGDPFDPDEGLRDLALRVGDVLGVHLYGIDLVLTDAGPVVVDVNAFPGFRGVERAELLVADHVLTHL